MEGQNFAVFGVIEGKDDLVVIDEHRVQENFDEPLLAVNVGVVHVCELVQEEPDVFLLQTQLLLQPGRRQSYTEFLLLLLQLIHAVFGAFVEDTGFDGPKEVGDGFLRFRQGGLEGIGIAGVRVLGDIVLIGAFRNELQKLLTANQIAQMLQHQMLDPVLPDGPFCAELFLFRTADVVVVLHMLLAGAADTGHVCAAFAAEDLAEQEIIHLRLLVTGGLLVDGQQLLCATFLKAVIRFYENEDNMRAFEAWRRRKVGTADEPEGS